MPRKTDTTPPWQELEKQAYHAYREWPLWLFLRKRELDERLGKGTSKPRTPTPARTGERPSGKLGS